MIDYNITNPEPEDVLNKDIVHDFVEFSGMSLEEVRERIKKIFKLI